MRKSIAKVLILALLCTQLAACGGQAQDAPEAETVVQTEETLRITRNLLADWYAYIVRCEHLYANFQWALSYLEDFFEDHSWDKLQTARAALTRSQMILDAESLPDALMTFDDYHKLIQAGMDVSHVQVAFDNIPSTKDSASLDYQILRDYLNSPAEQFYLTYDLEKFAAWVDVMGQIYEIALCSCAIETDHLLLTVDNAEEEAHFLDVIAKNCPQINVRRKDNPKDQDALLEKASALSEEMESLVGELSSTVGQSQASFDLYKDLSELDTSKGLEEVYRWADTIATDMVELQGFPVAFPYPDWWYIQDNETFMYLWDPVDGEDGEHTLMPGDPIERPPDQCLMTWEGVSLEEYLNYIKTLENYGIFADMSAKTDDLYIDSYEFPETSLMLSWDDNEVSLFPSEGSVCLAPPWYVIHTTRDFS